jgi:hypothetical protein
MTKKPSQKYFCQKCKLPKEPFLAPIWIDKETGERLKKPYHIEVIVTLPNKKDLKEGEERESFKGRKLDCGHYISINTPSFLDYPTENLGIDETNQIRRKIEQSIIKKTPTEVEATILRHAEEYRNLLAISSKLGKQAKYALQLVDDMREKYQNVLSPEEAMTFEQKFTALFGRKPIPIQIKSDVTVKADKAAIKERAALDAVKAILKKRGYSVKSIFKKEQIESKKEKEQND